MSRRLRRCQRPPRRACLWRPAKNDGASGTRSPGRRRRNGGLAKTDAINESTGVVKPGITAMKLGQRGAGQRVEGPAARLAHVALEARGFAAIAAPAADDLGLAVATGGSCRKARFNQGGHFVGRALRRQRCDDRIALHRRQITQLFDECPEFLSFHGGVPRVAIHTRSQRLHQG